MSAFRPRWVLATVALLVIAAGLLYRNQRHRSLPLTTTSSPGTSPNRADSDPLDQDTVREVSMAEVLEMARAARRRLEQDLDDYTARLVKQEMDRSGIVGPETEMQIKVQTRFNGDQTDAPLRVYLRFTAPDSVNGREVIWGEDLYDGKMAVHEVGLLLSLKTLWLDPTGIIAMQGQRYPITQIGLVRLVEQLIERGRKDVDDPDVRVTIDPNHRFDDLDTQLIVVRRSRPSGQPDDFSLAEIVIDPNRQLVLAFRSFGWPSEEGAEPPVIESYAYHDLQTNVGLKPEDFDTTNPAYSFPSF